MNKNEPNNNKKTDLGGNLPPDKVTQQLPGPSEEEIIKRELSRELESRPAFARQSRSDILEEELASKPSASPLPQKPLSPFQPSEAEEEPEKKPPVLTPKPEEEKEEAVPPSPLRPSVPEREFPRERVFPKKREFIPSKKEREFISREAETPKEIIRTFQKDLLRREVEVKREEKIPEKEITGFAPPSPPEESRVSRPPKFPIPKISIPKISLKFALIIVVSVLFLGGFYLVYQLKPCIPPLCKKEGPTPTPMPFCDKELMENICPKSEESFPSCDIEKFCQEMNISPCGRENICKVLVPTPVCEPIELIAPVSLLPFISEEKIIISQKSKGEILSALYSIAEGGNYPRPSLIRILIEYDQDKCNKNWVSLRELFEIFEIKTPENFLINLKENYTLVYYLPDSEEKNACLASNIESLLCYSPRLAIVFSMANPDIVKLAMQSWEPTFFSDFKPFILGEPKEEILEFKDYLYKEKVPLRYKNLPISSIALNYGLYKELLIIGASKNSLTKTIDLILKKEEQEALEKKMLAP